MSLLIWGKRVEVRGRGTGALRAKILVARGVGEVCGGDVGDPGSAVCIALRKVPREGDVLNPLDPLDPLDCRLIVVSSTIGVGEITRPDPVEDVRLCVGREGAAADRAV